MEFWKEMSACPKDHEVLVIRKDGAVVQAYYDPLKGWLNEDTGRIVPLYWAEIPKLPESFLKSKIPDDSDEKIIVTRAEEA